MNCALIGCGRIAANHIKAAIGNGLHLSAVCDVKPEAMEALLAKHGLAGDASIKRYTDYRQLLAEGGIELAAIATESGLHAQIALDCIDAGVHVIIEKPMAMSMADAEEIIRRSRTRGVKVCACHQNRFNAAVQEARKALEGGRAVWKAVPRLHSRPLESKPGILHPGPLARNLGSGRRLSDEPVYPRH